MDFFYKWEEEENKPERGVGIRARGGTKKTYRCRPEASAKDEQTVVARTGYWPSPVTAPLNGGTLTGKWTPDTAADSAGVMGMVAAGSLVRTDPTWNIYFKQVEI